MWRKAFRIGVGVVLLLLGLLWALQGADVIRIKPIGCVAECEPISGGSIRWLIAGVLAMLGGTLMLVARRRRD
jgi:hypothetical protein